MSHLRSLSSTRRRLQRLPTRFLKTGYKRKTAKNGLTVNPTFSHQHRALMLRTTRSKVHNMAERAYAGATSRTNHEVSKAVEMLQGLRGRGLRSACAHACIYLRFPTSLLLSLLVHYVSGLLVLLVSNKPRCPSLQWSSCSPVRNSMLGRSLSSVSRLPRPYGHIAIYFMLCR